MCMKYINTNVQCFDSSSKGLLGSLGLPFILESVKSTSKEDKFVVGGFNIAVFVNIRGTKDETNMENPLNAKKKLDFKIRLTKLSPNNEDQFSYDLREFRIDLSDASSIKQACFKYVERIEVVEIDDLLLNATGSYVIKILVKDSEDELYDVQMLHPLCVK